MLFAFSLDNQILAEAEPRRKEFIFNSAELGDASRLSCKVTPSITDLTTPSPDKHKPNFTDRSKILVMAKPMSLSGTEKTTSHWKCIWCFRFIQTGADMVQFPEPLECILWLITNTWASQNTLWLVCRDNQHPQAFIPYCFIYSMQIYT